MEEGATDKYSHHIHWVMQHQVEGEASKEQSTRSPQGSETRDRKSKLGLSIPLGCGPETGLALYQCITVTSLVLYASP